ncbi:MAG: peptidase M28, partial [Acidobacteriota bacterium]
MMKTVLCLAALLTALPAPARVTPAFSGERIKADVAFLSDDLLEGREAGTRGHEIAARYIAAQFAILGVR